MDATPRPRTNGIRAIEESTTSGWAWAALLFGWILARNLLEGVLERPHQLGFDGRQDLSFAMVFLHFPLFYLAVFLGLVLWLHCLTRRPVAGVARVVTIGYAILPIAPIADAIISGGRGYDLKYLLGFGSVLVRFWDPAAPMSEVSPGQRVEIALAVLLCGAYAWIAMRRTGPRAEAGRRAWSRPVVALLAATGAFMIMALAGAWPSLFAKLGAAGSYGNEGSYLAAFRLRGLVVEESRRLAVVMALPFLVGAVAFAWRLNASRFVAFLRAVSWLRLAYYSGLVLAGYWLGRLSYRAYLGDSGNPTDAAAVAILWASMAAAYLAALVWNDLHDREADRINEPHRRRAVGVLSEATARGLAVIAAALALFLALCVGYVPFLLMTAVLLLAWLYSAPPVRAKRWPGVATLTLGFLSTLSLASGYSLFAQEMTLSVLPWRVAGYLLVGVTLGFTAKDLKDTVGDRATGVMTLSTLLPEGTARGVMGALVAVGYLLGPAFVPLGPGFTITAILFAAGSAWVTMRRRRPEALLLAGFMIFAVLCLGFLTMRPEILRDLRVPTELRDGHAQIRAAEEDLRIARLCEEDAAAALCVGDDAREVAARALATVDRLLARMPVSGAISAEPAGERVRLVRAQAAGWPIAREDLEALIRFRPLRGEYRDIALRAATRAVDIDAARATCDGTIDRWVRPGDFLRNRASLAIASGEVGASAARDLAAAFRFGQREPLCWVLLGDLALRRGEPSPAIEAYSRAARCDPELAEAWAGLGEAQHARGDLAAALEAFARARTLAPRDPWVINNEGVALREVGRIDEALRRFEQAHALAPDLFEPLFNLGITCERLKRPAEARRWYALARGLRPGFPPLEEAMGRLNPDRPRRP